MERDLALEYGATRSISSDLTAVERAKAHSLNLQAEHISITIN
jgi:hypothetical protein